MDMQVAKLFMNGRSQAVRLPKEFRFEGDEVFVYKEDDKVILVTKKPSWEEYFLKTDKPTDDFMEDRGDLPPQEREDLF